MHLSLYTNKLNSSFFTSDNHRGDDRIGGVLSYSYTRPSENTRLQTIVSCAFLLAISILVVAFQIAQIVIDTFNFEATNNYSMKFVVSS